MLPGFQKKIFSIGRALYLLLLAACLASAFVLFRGGLPRPAQAATAASILAALLGSAALVVLLRNLYWKSSAPEAFFAALYFVSLTLESLRLVILLAAFHEAPLELRLLLTRLVLLGRIFGMGCLLLSGLHAVGMKAVNLRLPVGLSLAVALVLAALLPLDSTRLGPDLLYPLGDPHGFRFVEAALAVLVIVDFAAASFVRGDRRFLWVALAAGGLAGGRLLFQYGLSPLALGAGVALVMVGGWTLAKRLGAIYLWL